MSSIKTDAIRKEPESMRYGHFDEKEREYVIERPDTPKPWANYLGSPEYGAIISNNAGGYSFVKSGANGRIIRYIFNGEDKPGRYIYIRDNDSRDFWSASWQPVGKDLASYKNICRHGLGYSVFETDYSDIHSEALYYVPEGKTYEVWRIKVRNDGKSDRKLTVTGFAELTNHDNYEQDMVNLQYSQYITSTDFRGDRIRQKIHGNLDAETEKGDEVDGKGVTERFFGLAGAEVSSYCGDRDAFLGTYRGYDNPAGVADGDLGDVDAYNGYCCGALSSVIELAPGEEKTLAFVLGEHKDKKASEIMAHYKDTEAVCDREWSGIKEVWGSRLKTFQVKTPSPEFNTMINTWNAYNCYMTVIWSRAASFIYCGLRNGYGYRDTVQDIQGIIHLDPELALEKIRFMLTAQVDNGAGLPLVKFTHNPGHEDTPDDASYVQETGHPAYRADDALWLFPTVYKYIAETGNVDFLNEVLPFANKDEATVYEHLKRTIEFSLDHLGKHGLPAGLYADWNDCLRLGADGESAFVALQFYYALRIMKIFTVYEKDMKYADHLDLTEAEYLQKINELLWDGDRFIRGYTETGETVGDKKSQEARLWLNPQSWSVISGLATDEQADAALENVHENLNTEYGAILMDPPYHKHAFDGAFAVIYNQGTKENSGVFSQTQGWLILAEALRGHGDRAFEYWYENSPSVQNDKAEIRKLEPYCYGQFTEGKASPHAGESHVHWLTGTASTMMVGCVEGILGIRPDIGGLKLAPSIPKSWDHLEIDKDFRGKHLHITVENPGHAESGFKSMTLNGKSLSGNYIAEKLLTEDINEIILKIS